MGGAWTLHPRNERHVSCTLATVQWTEQQTVSTSSSFEWLLVGRLHSRSSGHQMDLTKAPLFALELRPLIDILGSRPWGPQESNPLPPQTESNSNESESSPGSFNQTPFFQYSEQTTVYFQDVDPSVCSS